MSMPQLQKLIHICILNQSTFQHFFHPPKRHSFPHTIPSFHSDPYFSYFSPPSNQVVPVVIWHYPIILTIKISFLILMDKFTKNYIDDIVKPMLNRIELL